MDNQLEGQSVPEVNFKHIENGKVVEYSSYSLFKGKRVILFSVPGAFTLICSLVHLPEYEEFYDLFRKEGIDEIHCVASNDAYTMQAWAQESNISKVKLLSDPRTEFSQALNLTSDSDLLGLRSGRYALIINDGVIEKAFIEEDITKLTQSRAKYVLTQLNAEVKIPDNIVIYTLTNCTHCKKAKEILISKELFFSEKVFNQDYNLSDLKAMSGTTSVPQVFINGKLIGGETELSKYLNLDKEEYNE